MGHMSSMTGIYQVISGEGTADEMRMLQNRKAKWTFIGDEMKSWTVTQDWVARDS